MLSSVECIKKLRRTLICGATIVTMNAQREVLKNQDILVEGDRIIDIGQLNTLSGMVDEIIYAHGRLVIPGLIQTRPISTLLRRFSETW